MNDTLELRSIEDLLSNPPQNVDVDFIYTNKDRDPSWLAFLKGAYDMPITWWTGIIHCLMLAGIWGSKYKSAAQINQQRLDLALEKLASHPDKVKIRNTCAAVALYNKEYLSGRFAGGVFVSSTINKALRNFNFIKKYTIAAKAGSFGFNLSISSFGAALITVASGYNSAYDVVYSIITGTTQKFPITEPIIDFLIEETINSAQKEIQNTDQLIMVVEKLNDLQPQSARSYEEWCKANPDQATEAYFCQ